MTVENETFQELDGDQRRETVNTRQRFDTFLAAQERLNGYRGSMVFARSNGAQHLVRSFYDPRTGRRRQTSLGPRDADKERLKAGFDAGRREATERLAAAREGIERQAGINRVLGLGRVPLLGARILRALDAAQAAAVAGLVARYLPHLPFRTDDPRGFPRDVVVQAASLFAGASHPAARFEW